MTLLNGSINSKIKPIMAKKRTYFDPVDTKVDFPAKERKLLGDWYKKGIVKKYLVKNRNSKKYFSFLDGPITANNPMGVHHAWGRTYKDLWQRFKNMQGYKQRFQNGFDCQGLWVEVEVEKELGFKNKKDIEEFGVDKFVQLCKDRVKKYSQIQTEQSKRLGYFMDWDHSYFTLSDENNYTIWHFLKKCHEAGWIYKGADSVPWCPRCETAISQHEMLTEDYKELTHESIYLAFPIVGSKDEYLMVWTTTPWTVPANIAVAIDSDLSYSLIEVSGKKYWLAEGARERVIAGKKAKILKTVRGSKLVGLRYEGAFDGLSRVKEAAKADKFHTIVATDNLLLPISVDEGTGLVHTAVSAGAEDFKLGKKLGLPMIPIIEDDASYVEGLGDFSGKNAKKHPEVVLDYLEKLDKEGKHFYYKTEKITHRYPACWRCKTELVWKVTDEWYIAMDQPSREASAGKYSATLRQKMKDVAGKINWIPGFGLEREMDWLTNMHDWLISKKNRYWGLALPIWECAKCGNFEVIGSREELKERAVEGWKGFKGKSPHKPQVDGIKIKCSKCGDISQRIEPVGNPWLDAGIVPFSTISEDNTKPLYLRDRKGWEKWFPVNFITESFPGQFKNWFYSLIAMATVLENVNPMETVLGYGSMLGEDGRPMHKSWGNAIEFNEGADKIGVDVMRWMFARQNPADNLLFGYKAANETRRMFHLKLWNIYNFFVTYANLDNWTPGRLKSVNTLDRWLTIRLNQTILETTQSLERFDAFTAAASIDKFVDDFSLWYIRRSRDRVGPAAESEGDKKAFYSTAYNALVTLTKLLAPFTPFFSDTIYKNLTKEESVHLSDWPRLAQRTSRLKSGELKVVGEMEKARALVEKAHALRKEKGIVLKQALNSYSTKDKKLSRDTEKLIKDEINVKKIIWGAKADSLDTKITKELKEEAEVRDLMRKIQAERKKMGLNLTQKVNVLVDEIPTNNKVVHWLMVKAQIKNIDKGKFKVSKA